ncbi:MAG: PKD domain-containing protein, partial [Candidatus Bathyarchaeia archaeon]
MASIFSVTVKGYDSSVLYAHAETTTAGGSCYYLFKSSSADGPATVLSASAATTGRKLMGKWVYPLSGIESIPASTWAVSYRAMKSASASYVVAHCDIDISIRKGDGTIRSTIATNVANSPDINLINTWMTLTGTYNWPGYTVVDQTDYLEVDFYIEVTNPQSSKYVRLLVDDPTLPIADQTKIEGIIFDFSNQPPIASFTYHPTDPFIYETVTFDASASFDPDGSIVSYTWDFGDGNITTVPDPVITHVYTTAGSTVNYTVTLTVTDNEGLTGFSSQTVPVINPAILRVSLPAGTYVGPNPDHWLSQCWLLNITGVSGSFNMRISNIHSSIESYDTHLIIAINNPAYENLQSLTVNDVPIPKSSFTYGTPRPYGFQIEWEEDVYPTWFSTASVGNISASSYIDATVSIAFTDPTDVRVHFDAFGSAIYPPPPKCNGHVTHNPHEKDSTVQFFPTPIIKYYLGVKTDPEDVTTIPGEGWYDEGTEVTLAAPDIVSVSPGVRYKFSYWDVDGTPKAGNPITVVMDANHTAIAHYVLEYYLTVTSPFGTVGGEGWYQSGTTAYATLDTGLVDHGNGTRRVFVNWSGDASGTNYAQSDPMIMNSPKTAVANWKTQYAVTFTQTGSDVAPTVTYTADTDPTETVPFTVWVLAGSQITYAYQDIVLGAAPGVRYILTSVNPPSPQIVNAPFTVSASYQVQYYLTVLTDPPGIATIPGEGWYNPAQSVQLNAPAVAGYTFQYWDVDGVSQGSGVNPITVVMNAPHTATAHYTAVVPTYTLKIETTAGGTTNPTPGTYTYAAGSLVQVTAIPSSGYVFDHWELNGTNVGTATTYTVTMNNNYVLKAFFKAAPTPPTVSISPMSASILVGQQVTFTSTVSGGTPPYTYQWFVNNNPVSGATSSSFVFTPTAAGTYYVVLKVTDAAGNTAQSDPARVTVSSVPVGGYSVALTKN